MADSAALAGNFYGDTMNIKIDGHLFDAVKVAGFVRADSIVSVSAAQLLAAVERDGTYEVWKDGPPGDEELVRHNHFIGVREGDGFYCVPAPTMHRWNLPVVPCLCHATFSETL